MYNCISNLCGNGLFYQEVRYQVAEAHGTSDGSIVGLYKMESDLVRSQGETREGCSLVEKHDRI